MTLTMLMKMVAAGLVVLVTNERLRKLENCFA